MSIVNELDPSTVQSDIRHFLKEDIGTGDLTTNGVIPADAVTRGWLVTRQECVVAGIEIAGWVFAELDETIGYEVLVADGSCAAPGTRLAHIEGRAAPILSAERVALNLLQRMCGVATLTRTFVDAVAGSGIKISDTRKTTPGLRLYEKYAVRVAGGRNHRFGLYDAILVKDNHVAIAGNTQMALLRALKQNTRGVPVQIEVDRLEQLDRLLDLGLDAVLLDNMTAEQVNLCVRKIRGHPQGTRCWIEVSGGITLANIGTYVDTGVDTISIGALTHSVKSVDLSLDLEL